jgi:uncharacterized protein YajQ (UPF0234 family)
MPTFDIVSEFDQHEVVNAVDQANRELGTRFDFKGVKASFALEGEKIILSAEGDFQLQQMMDILQKKLVKRGIDLAHLKVSDPEIQLSKATQEVLLQKGIEAEFAKKIVKIIKAEKMKVQASIQGDKVRVSGKKRDDLQEAIALLRAQELERPLQFENFRD